jgi:anti-sigma regulatory factor (Ser/Thr protein kinase)
MSEERPLVHLKLRSTPETLTLVRGALGALAELLALDPELLDDMKTAISEACNNVVMHAYAEGTGPLEVTLQSRTAAIEAIVRDEGRGIPDAVDPDEGVHGVGLPLIKALTNDDAEFVGREGGGTEVRMRFSGRRRSRTLFNAPADVAAEDCWVRRLSGDAVVSLSPVSFLGPVLGRLARALAARARFSLDRFSDVYLVTDAIAAHATRAATHARVGFAIRTAPRRLEISVGPLRDGSGKRLDADDQVREPGSALTLLSDAVTSTAVDGGELLSIVMTDDPRKSTVSR